MPMLQQGASHKGDERGLTRRRAVIVDGFKPDAYQRITKLLRTVWRMARTTHNNLISGNLDVPNYDEAVKLYKSLCSSVNTLRRSKKKDSFLNISSDTLLLEKDANLNMSQEMKDKLVCIDVYKHMMKDSIFNRSSSIAHELNDELKDTVEIGDSVAIVDVWGDEIIRKVKKCNDDNSFVLADWTSNVPRRKLRIIERAELSESAATEREHTISYIRDFRHVYDVKAFPRSEYIFTAFRANSTKVIEVISHPPYPRSITNSIR